MKNQVYQCVHCGKVSVNLSYAQTEVLFFRAMARINRPINHDKYNRRWSDFRWAIAYYLRKEGAGLVNIGKVLGYRDHSTVSWGIKKVQIGLKSSSASHWRALIDFISGKVRATPTRFAALADVRVARPYGTEQPRLKKAS